MDCEKCGEPMSLIDGHKCKAEQMVASLPSVPGYFLGYFMLRKLLCFIGYHEWTWTLGVDCEFVSLNGPPPETARCLRPLRTGPPRH